MSRRLALLMALALGANHAFAQESSWKVLPLANYRGDRYESVFFSTPEIGWIVHINGLIFKTVNGGITWNLQLGDFRVNFRSIAFADSLHGWAGSLNAPVLWRTINGGMSWASVGNLVNPRPAGICGISVVNASVIYASGKYDGPAVVIKSIDGGQTWASIDMRAYANNLIDCYFFSPDSGFVVGGSPNGIYPDVSAVVLFTADGGSNWETRYTTSRIKEWGWKISFPTPKVGYVAIESENDQAYVLKTKDGGSTWEEKFVGNGLRMQGIGFVNESTGWVGTHFGMTDRTYMTTDGGETWREADFGERLNRFHIVNENLAYAVGATVYKYSPEEIANFQDAGAGLAGLDGVEKLMAWGDYDNDDDLDLFLAGEDLLSFQKFAAIYRNDNGNFANINAAVSGVSRGSAKWGDYDNDGDLDLLLSGVDENGAVSKIYKNASGSFEDIAAPLEALFSSAVDWVDYDNDGDLDVFLSGSSTRLGPFTRIYQNHDGEFSEIAAALLNVFDAAADWGDYDQDGDFDLLLIGQSTPGNVPPSILVYRNDSGRFALTSISLAGITQLGTGSAGWGDYDNDGDLDILLGTRLYRNDGGAFANIPFKFGETGQDAGWGDFDNDGDLDILQSSGPGIIRNNGGSFEFLTTSISPREASALAWSDFDKDNDLDVVVAGPLNLGEETHASQIYRNEIDMINTPPLAPTLLTARVEGDSVILSWEKAIDSETPQAGLTYNLRVGTSPGGVEIVSPHANVAIGFRKIVDFGNAGNSAMWKLQHLPQGVYYWSVQAIDHGFLGSPFAEERIFVIGTTAVEEAEDRDIPQSYSLSQNYPNPFNPVTTIAYALPQRAQVTLRIFNLSGEEVATLVDARQQNAGRYRVFWDGSAFASGVFFYRLEAGSFIHTMKLILLR